MLLLVKRRAMLSMTGDPEGFRVRVSAAWLAGKLQGDHYTQFRFVLLIPATAGKQEHHYFWTRPLLTIIIH